MSDEAPIGWAIVELMGHRRLAGYVREVQIAGAGMLRLDIPAGPVLPEAITEDVPEDRVATQFYSPAAVYCITPTKEWWVRALALRIQPQPAARWELEPAVEYVPASEGGDDFDEERDRPF